MFLPKNVQVNTSVYYKGESVESLVTSVSLPPLIPSGNHSDDHGEKSHELYSEECKDEWNDSYVRMPFSDENVYSVIKGGERFIQSRWSLIEDTLRQKIPSCNDFKEAVLSFNSRFRSAWNFSVFQFICSENLIPDCETDIFFKETMPALCALALNLPVYLTKPIPLLKAGEELSLTLSQLQIASLLANAFFCTFPRRNNPGRVPSYPTINFSSLFSHKLDNVSGRRRECRTKVEKLRCILHYFCRVLKSFPSGNVTFTRRCLGDRKPDWSNSTLSFDKLKIHINATESLFDAGANTLQVDFANSYLGGGVLNTGCVQEEILFVLRPELLVTCLFVERLRPDETLLIEGAEQYSVGKGYGRSFYWSENFDQSESGMTRDEWGRWRYAVVAMDAINFKNHENQFSPNAMLRELNKAYCGFTDELAPNHKIPHVVATGNWGCGAFNGNVELKSILQMMACLQAKKALAYYTFGDRGLCDRMHEMYTILSDNRVTIGQLWRIISEKLTYQLRKTDSVYDIIQQELKLQCSK